MKENKMSKKIIAGSIVAIAIALLPQATFAHVVVKPNETKPGAFQTFTVSVPNEKSAPTTALKLEVPAGLKHVTPTVKTGWQVVVEKEGEGEAATVKAISWTGGIVPAGLRDDFTFSAQVPSEATTLKWKAYQTYESGVVSWDLEENQQPTTADGKPDFSTAGPLSTTKVAPDTTPLNSAEQTANRSFYVAVAGILISLGALFLATRKK
jgi:uncharacterized protein YcnI